MQFNDVKSRISRSMIEEITAAICKRVRDEDGRERERERETARARARERERERKREMSRAESYSD